MMDDKFLLVFFFQFQWTVLPCCSWVHSLSTICLWSILHQGLCFSNVVLHRKAPFELWWYERRHQLHLPQGFLACVLRGMSNGKSGTPGPWVIPISS